MYFDKDKLKHLSHLCRIECTDEELEKLLVNFDAILSHMQQLEEIDTSDIPPSVHVNTTTPLAFEADEERDVIDHKDLMQNAPEAIGGMIKVPPIRN